MTNSNHTQIPIEWIIGLLELQKEGKLNPNSKSGHVEKAPESGHNWSEIADFSEVSERKLPPEIQEHLVVIPHTPQISTEEEAAGVQSTGQTNYPSYLSKKIPLTDEEVALNEKKPITDPLRWLAEFCKYLLKQGNIVLKTVHGRVIRERVK